MRIFALSVLAACAGTPEPTEPAPAEPVVTVLWSGRDGVLYSGPDGTDHAPLGDPSLRPSITPGHGLRLRLDADGRVVGADPVPDAPVVEPPKEYPLTGTVVELDGDRVHVDHDAVAGLMSAMVMPFSVTDEVRGWIRPGDRIEARLVPTSGGYWLVDVLRTGRSSSTLDFHVDPLVPGASVPRTELATTDGGTVVVGEGQGRPTVLTFLYSTCPDPAYCPALIARLQPLQAAIGDDARIVAVTIDPEIDTAPVLGAYAKTVGADPATWVFAVPTLTQLGRLAQLAGLTVSVDSGRITHSTRVLVLDAEGRLVERYDDNAFPQERVVAQLRGEAVTPR